MFALNVNVICVVFDNLSVWCEASLGAMRTLMEVESCLKLGNTRVKKELSLG